MAAEVLLLLVLMANNIHAQVLLRAGDSHHFILDETADACSVSTWTGEEKKLLWSSSREKAAYGIFSLNVSDSGQYQVQCWTRGNLMYEMNSTLLVCGTQKMRQESLYVKLGQRLELACAGPNQGVQWAFHEQNEKKKIALVEDATSSMYELQLVKNKSSLVLTVDKPSYDVFYYCLEQNQQRCEVLNSFEVHVPPEYFLHSVGESLELNCSDIDQPHVWRMMNLLTGDEVSHNHTLMLPSLTLDHTGGYTCELSDLSVKFYHLFVCPESDPVVMFFTGGENVTVHCGNRNETDSIYWFTRSKRTEGRVLRVLWHGQSENRYRGFTPLVITNFSLEDSGEFWCVILTRDRCVFTSKTIVMFREPEVDHHLVRSVLLAVVIMMMCVVVVASVWWTRSREQLPVPVEEVEMSELSPASADLQLETLYVNN